MVKILILDDEPSIRKALALSLRGAGYEVCEADSLAAGKAQLVSFQPALIISDLFVPTEEDGLEMLKFCQQNTPGTPVLVMTAHGSLERAVAAIKAGADDFIAKGFQMEELHFRLERLLKQRMLREANMALAEKARHLQKELEDRYRYREIVGNSKAMRDLLSLLSRVVNDHSSTVLLQGESGTGKELIARAIHFNGPRRENPFVVVNCAALPENLLESELFGFEKGAFTGATSAKPGKFEIADGGTIFLDEIGELSPKMQGQLLRFLQDFTFERLGSIQPRKVDVRIISATNKNLEAGVVAGRFREDLFYRLNVIPLLIPPLRERAEDFPLLLNYFVGKFYRQKGRKIQFSAAALAQLEQYPWPGNVRQLENLVERLVVTAPEDTIALSDLPPQFCASAEKTGLDLPETAPDLAGMSLKAACQAFEKAFLQRHLEKHHWNISEVARILNERRDTLSRKIKRYGLKSR